MSYIVFLFCIIRYSYPFFGSSGPVLTNPPVYLQRNCEIVLPQSFCQFEFASNLDTLQATLSRYFSSCDVTHKTFYIYVYALQCLQRPKTTRNAL